MIKDNPRSSLALLGMSEEVKEDGWVEDGAEGFLEGYFHVPANEVEALLEKSGSLGIFLSRIGSAGLKTGEVLMIQAADEDCKSYLRRVLEESSHCASGLSFRRGGVNDVGLNQPLCESLDRIWALRGMRSGMTSQSVRDMIESLGWRIEDHQLGVVQGEAPWRFHGRPLTQNPVKSHYTYKLQDGTRLLIVPWVERRWGKKLSKEAKSELPGLDEEQAEIQDMI